MTAIEIARRVVRKLAREALHLECDHCHLNISEAENIIEDAILDVLLEKEGLVVHEKD